MPLPPDRKRLIETATRMFLEAIGVDPEHEEDFQETPKRVAEMYSKVLDGNFRPLENGDTKSFSNGLEDVSETQFKGMLVVKDIPFYGWCAHHLLPMIGVMHIGYFPDKKKLGLSKIVRIARHQTRVPSTQEEITNKVIVNISRFAETDDVAVYIEAEHMCMTLRGSRAHNSSTITYDLSGCFLKDNLSHDFLGAIK